METSNGSLDMTPHRESRRSVVAPIVLWLFFAAGLVLQFFSPHLVVRQNSFVIPAGDARPGSVVDPRALIQRQRMVQAASAGLVLIGVVGLGIWYRDALFRSVAGSHSR